MLQIVSSRNIVSKLIFISSFPFCYVYEIHTSIYRHVKQLVAFLLYLLSYFCQHCFSQCMAHYSYGPQCFFVYMFVFSIHLKGEYLGTHYAKLQLTCGCAFNWLGVASLLISPYLNFLCVCHFSSCPYRHTPW